MSKKAKIWIVIGSIFKTLNFLAIIIIFIVGSFFSIFGTKQIMSEYQHNSSFIYIDATEFYFNGQNYKCAYNVLWLDDDCLIYQKDNSIYYEDSEKTKLLMLGDIDSINYGSVFYKNSSMYFKSIDIFYSYDIENNLLSPISITDYNSLKNGNKYQVDLSVRDLKMVLSITDIQSNSNKIIDYKVLKKNKTIKFFYDNYKIRLFNYLICDDIIYLYLYSGPYSIIVTYDYETEKIEIYDWFYRKESRTCYLAFKISDINNVPVLKDYIK